MKNYKEINDEPSKEQLYLWDKRSQLCSMLDTCYVIATDNHKKNTLLESKISTLKNEICRCDSIEDLNKLAYQVIYFVHEFICFRN